MAQEIKRKHKLGKTIQNSNFGQGYSWLFEGEGNPSTGTPLEIQKLNDINAPIGSNFLDLVTGTSYVKIDSTPNENRGLYKVGVWAAVSGEKSSLVDLVAEKNEFIQSKIGDYVSNLSDLNISKSEYEDLLEYENRKYILDDGSIYDVDTKIGDCNYVFGVNDCLVSTSGDNGTGVIGDESSTFATWEYAIDQIPISGGVTIWIEGGSYNMNTSGTGYAILNRAFESPVVVKSKPNETVTLNHTSQVYSVRFLSTSENVVFEDLVFTPKSGDIATLFAAGAISVNNIEVRDCVFDNGGSSHNYATQFGSQTSNINNKVKRCVMQSGDGLNGAYFDKATNLTFIGNKSNPSVDVDRVFRLVSGSQGIINVSNNTINSTSTTTGTHSVFQMNGALIGDSTINFNNNSITTKSAVMELLGKSTGRGVELNIIGNNVVTDASRAISGSKSVYLGKVKYNTITAENVCLGLPQEGAVVSGSEFGGLDIAYNNLNSANHTLLCGENGLRNNISNNILDARSGFYSFVCKGNSHVMSNNVMYGGSQTSLLFKNAENCISSNDMIVQEVALGSAIRFDKGLVFGSKNNSVTNANIKVVEGNLIEGIDSDNLGEGNFIDNNYYEITDNGEWGIIYDSVSSLQDLRRAWRVNIVGSKNNDLNSDSINIR